MTTHSTPRFRFLIAIILLIAFASSARAQMDAGFIGKRYAGLDFFSENVRTVGIDNGSGVELFGNVPIVESLDASLRLSSERFDSYSITDRRITGSVLGYIDMDWIKPYAELSATTTDQSSTVRNVKYKNRETLWGVGLGLEIPCTRSSAIFCSATRNEYFNSEYNAYWTYKIGLNTWITPKIGLVLAASVWDGESTTYSAGLTVRF
jgi:hypothetical protein